VSSPRAAGPLPQAILVSGADGAISLIHALTRKGLSVSVLVTWKRAWVARSRMVDGHVLGRLPDAREEWLSTLERLAERGDGVLISGSDRATEFLVAERERIPENLRSFESPGSAHLRLMDKASLYELAEGAGIRTPWTLRLSSAAELEGVMERASYPCVVKPALSHLWRRLFGEHRVLFARGPEDLARLAAPGLEAGLELLVSEYVPGPEANLENAVLVRDADGSFPLAYGLRRLRQYPPGFGASALTESADAPETMRLGRSLLEAAGFVGLASVQTKRDERTGEPVLIEANVRVPQHFGLGEACGVEAPWRLYASLAGLPLGPQPPQRIGVRNVVATMEPRAAWMHLADGGSLRSLLRSYRGVRDVSGHTLSDPLPLWIMLYRQLKMGGGYVGSRIRGRRSRER
jgi:D-aspartate ligase